MTLISCPECAHQISDKAPTCPSCGYPVAGVSRHGVANMVGKVAGTWLSFSALESIIIAMVLFGSVAAVLITLIVVKG